MLEIWGRPLSSNVIPVIWAAEEAGAPFRVKLAGGRFGQLDTDSFASMNPNRLIPTINDDGFVLWESHAIVRYICKTYADGILSPSDARAYAVADQWMEWSNSRAFKAVFPLFWDTVRTDPEKRDPVQLAAKANAAADVMAILDGHLANRAFILGDTFSMADIPLGAVVYRYFNVEVERPSFANIEAWYERLSDRPAYRKHVMRYFGTNPTEWAELERLSSESLEGGI